MGRIPEQTEPEIDWRLATWEGSRREQMRRWAELPLDRIILAIEDMEETTRRLQGVFQDQPSTERSMEGRRPRRP